MLPVTSGYLGNSVAPGESKKVRFCTIGGQAIRYVMYLGSSSIADSGLGKSSINDSFEAFAQGG